MASAFNLTAQLNIRGPNNVNKIVSDIKRQLGTIQGNVDLKINATSARNITALNSALKNLNVSLADTNTNAKSAATAISAFVNAAGSINNTTSVTATNLAKAANATKGLSSSSKVTAQQLAAARTEMEEFGRQSALAVRRFAAFSAATSVIFGLANAFRQAFGAFIEFDRAFVKLQQVTNKSGSELQNLSKEITTLSVGLGVASADLVSVAQTLAQAGLSARETEKALKALALSDLAPSFDNMNSTVEGSIALMRQFGISAGELEKALGSVNAVAAGFAVEASDIIAAIQRTGGVFAAASKGVSEGTDALNEFIAVFTSVRATTRESAETIATGLRTIFTRIQRESTIEALREFGVTLTDAEGKFVGAYKAVQLLSEGLSKLDPRDIKFSQIVEELGGFRQIGKVIPLIQQFTTAQQALKVAQAGQGSLADDAIKAQLSLANQISKVREEFLALARDIGSSDTFQTLAKTALGFASGLIKVASSLRGVLPVLAILGISKGASALTQFGSGFIGGLKKVKADDKGQPQTLSSSLGSRIGGVIGGGGGANIDFSQLNNSINSLTKNIDNLILSLNTINGLSSELTNNTSSLITNTASIDSLTAAISNINLGGGTTLNKGGKVMAFARGGVVPGTGNRDTVPAMLQPGEFVIRKKAVETIGANNLHNINKYADGGKVNITAKELQTRYRATKTVKNLITNSADKSSYESGHAINEQDNISFNRRIYKLNAPDLVNDSYGFEEAVAKKTNGILTSVGKNDPSFPIDITNSNYGPLEVRNRNSSTSNRTLLDKLIRYYIESNQSNRLKNAPSIDDISLGNLGLVYNSAKYNPPNAKELNVGGIVQRFAKGGKALGARSKFKELTPEEIAQLSTRDLIAYGKALAEDIFTTGGAGMAVGHEFIEIPPERIVPELESSLVEYMGKKGFWREKVAPFGKAQTNTNSAKQSAEIDRKAALEAQVSKQADEVAAREQQWTKIRTGSAIDKYLLSTLTDPILSDYETVKRGESLPKAFHSTRLRQAVNKALESYDDFDYSPANIDKLVSGMASKRFAYGGLIQKFAQGSIVGSAGSISEDIIRRINELGGPGPIKEAVTLDFINSTIKQKLAGKRIMAKDLLSPRSLRSNSDSASLLPAIEPILKKAEDIKREKDQAKKDQIARNLQASAGGAYQFGLASIFGPKGEFGYSDVSDAKEIEGKDGEKYLTQIVQKSLPSRYESVIKKLKDELTGAPQRAAENLQYADIFSTSGPLAFDFDETLVKGADIFDVGGKIDIKAYNDLQKVKESLQNAELTALGKELQKRTQEYPQLLDSIRVLTARPPNNAPLLASTLSRLELPISESKITGVNGGLNKVDNLSELETLIDDNLENIQSVLAGGKKAIQYQEARAVDLSDQSSRKSISVMEGYALEEMVRSLGVNVSEDDADPGRPIDFPKGLGAKARYWDLPPTIPTDTKRTNSSSAVNRLFAEAQRFYVQNFKLGGKVYDLQQGTGLSNSEFNQLVQFSKTNDFDIEQFKSYLTKYLQDKQNKKGLKTDSEALRQTLLGSTRSSQATPKQLDLAEQLKGEPDPQYRPKRFALGGLADAGTEMSGLMRGLYGSRQKTENEPKKAKKEKIFGKVGLRSSGNEITATYFKNQEREGFVSAKKASGNLYTIALSKASKGYGPYLYDIVMEAATIAGGMLTSDRNQVSDAAKAVWAFYFNNRSDVKKTPLDPSQWTKNQSYIDPKLYGKKETWPPPNDPAWILQTGYSKNPNLLNSPDVMDLNDSKNTDYIRQQQTAFLARNSGGIIQKFAKGGSAEDTVPALLTPGEFVINKNAAKKIGYAKLNRLNKADKLQGYNKGGSVGFVQRFADGGLSRQDIEAGFSIDRNLDTSQLTQLQEAAQQAGMNVKTFAAELINARDIARQTALDQGKSLQEAAEAGRQAAATFANIDLTSSGSESALLQTVGAASVVNQNVAENQRMLSVNIDPKSIRQMAEQARSNVGAKVYASNVRTGAEDPLDSSRTQMREAGQSVTGDILRQAISNRSLTVGDLNTALKNLSLRRTELQSKKDAGTEDFGVPQMIELNMLDQLAPQIEAKLQEVLGEAVTRVQPDKSAIAAEASDPVVRGTASPLIQTPQTKQQTIDIQNEIDVRRQQFEAQKTQLTQRQQGATSPTEASIIQSEIKSLTANFKNFEAAAKAAQDKYIAGFDAITKTISDAEQTEKEAIEKRDKAYQELVSAAQEQTTNWNSLSIEQQTAVVDQMKQSDVGSRVREAEAQVVKASDQKTTAERTKLEQYGDVTSREQLTSAVANESDAGLAKQVFSQAQAAAQAQNMLNDSYKALEIRAKQAGVSLRTYTNNLRQQIIETSKNKQKQSVQNVENLRLSSISKRASLSDTGVAGQEAAKEIRESLQATIGSSVSEQEFDRIAEVYIQNLRELDGTTEDVINSIPGLAQALQDSTTNQKAYEQTLQSLSQATGVSAQVLQQFANQSDIEGAQALEALDPIVNRLSSIGSKVGLVLSGLGTAASDAIKSFSGSDSRGGAVTAAAVSGFGTTAGAGLATIAQIPGAVKSTVESLSKMGGGVGRLASTLGPKLLGALTNPITAAVAVVGVAAVGVAAAFKDAHNAAREFDKALAAKNVENSMEKVSRAFESFEKDVKQVQLLDAIQQDLKKAGAGIAEGIRIDAEVPKAFWLNLFDALGGGAEAAQRSTILEQKGIGAYLRSSEIFAGKEQATINRNNFMASMAPDMAKQQSAQYKPVADQTLKLFQSQLQTGTNYSDIMGQLKDASGAPSQLAQNIARANPAIQEQILRIRASNKLRDDEKQSLEQQIVAQEATYQSTLALQQKLQELEFEKLQDEMTRFVVSLQRMYDNMDRAINKTSYELDGMSRSLELSNGALSGNAKAGDVSLRSINVLQNRNAYSSEDQQAAVNQASSFFGSESATMRSMLQVANKMETTVLSTLNKSLKEDPKASDEKLATSIRFSLNRALDDLELPPELSAKMSDQVQNAFSELRKAGDKDVTFDELVEKVPALSKQIDAARAAQEVAVRALEFWQKNVNEYAQAMNQAVEYQYQSNQSLRKAQDIEIKGRLDLSQALGRSTSLRDQQQASTAGIRSQTGGTANPAQIQQNLLNLNQTRSVQQGAADAAAQSGPSGRDQFILMQQRLGDTNLALKQNYDALNQLANSGDMASAALAKINEAQQKIQAGTNIIEKLVTSSPEEINKFNKALGNLSNNMAGRQNNSTAEERSASLQAFNMIAPLLGDSAQQNSLKANVLESMLLESGVGIDGMMSQVLDSLRNPESNPEIQAAMKYYEDSITTQKEANIALGQIQTLMSQNTSEMAAEKLAKSIEGAKLNFESQQLKDINDNIKGLREDVQNNKKDGVDAGGLASGGLIYAASGKHIEFTPKGTDTVPAMLTPGEFVVNRASTSKNLPLLQAINNGYKNGGKVSYYQDGGIVGIDSEKWKLKPTTRQMMRSRQELVTEKNYPILDKDDKNYVGEGKGARPDGVYIYSLPNSWYAETGSAGEQSYDENPGFLDTLKIRPKRGIGYDKVILKEKTKAGRVKTGTKTLIATGSPTTAIGVGVSAIASGKGYGKPPTIEPAIPAPIENNRIGALLTIDELNTSYGDLTSNNRVPSEKYRPVLLSEKDKIIQYYNNLINSLEDWKYKDIESKFSKATDVSNTPTFSPKIEKQGGNIVLSGLSSESKDGKNLLTTDPNTVKEGDPGNILGLAQTYWGGVQVLSGTNKMGEYGSGFDLSRGVTPFSVAENESNLATIKSWYEATNSLVETFKKGRDLLQKDSSFKESASSSGIKTSSSKLEALWNKNIFQAQFTQQELGDISDIPENAFPATVYNYPIEEWNKSDSIIGRKLESLKQSGVEAGVDFSSSSNPLKVGSYHYKSDTFSGLRSLPWANESVTKQLAEITKPLDESFKVNKPMKILKSTIFEGNDKHKGLFTIPYSIIEAPFYDEAKKELGSIVNKYVLANLVPNNKPDENPFAGLTSPVYFPNLETLAKTIQDQTPVYNLETDKWDFTPSNPYKYNINIPTTPSQELIAQAASLSRLDASEQKAILMGNYSGPNLSNTEFYGEAYEKWKNEGLKNVKLLKAQAGVKKSQKDKTIKASEEFTEAKRVTVARAAWDFLTGLPDGDMLKVNLPRSTRPVDLSTVATPAIEASQDAAQLSLQGGQGRNTLQYAKLIAWSNVFSGLFKGSESGSQYLKNLGLPLDNLSYFDQDRDGGDFGNIALVDRPIADPAESVKFYPKIKNIDGTDFDTNSFFRKLLQRELASIRSRSVTANARLSNQEDVKNKINMSLKGSERATTNEKGDRSPIDKPEQINTYEKLAEVALSPSQAYIPTNWVVRQRQLKQVRDYYATAKDDQNNLIYPPEFVKALESPTITIPDINLDSSIASIAEEVTKGKDSMKAGFGPWVNANIIAFLKKGSEALGGVTPQIQNLRDFYVLQDALVNTKDSGDLSLLKYLMVSGNSEDLTTALPFLKDIPPDTLKNIQEAFQTITRGINLDKILSLPPKAADDFSLLTGGRLDPPTSEFVRNWLLDRAVTLKAEQEKKNNDPIETQRFATGGMVYASSGQLINFQPKGTDTVPAMLTPGEFVINRKASAKHRSVLEAINSGNYSRGGIINYLNSGGLVFPNYYARGGTGSSAVAAFDFASFMQGLTSKLLSVIPEAIKTASERAASSTQNTSNGVSSIDSNVLDKLTEFTNRLKSVADTLANLSAIPSEIKITGRHDVNVIINGDSALNQLQPQLKDLVMKELKDGFDKLININQKSGGLLRNNPMN